MSFETPFLTTWAQVLLVLFLVEELELELLNAVWGCTGGSAKSEREQNFETHYRSVQG